MNRDVIVANLVTAVKKMRKEQKAYFSTRQQIHLIRAKENEAEVDKKLAEYDKFIIPNNQLPLS